MKRPFVAAALWYASGLLLGEFIHPPLWPLFLGALAALLAAVLLARGRALTLGLLLVLAAWTNHRTHTAVISPDDLRLVQGTNTSIVTLRGRLTETPFTRVLSRNGKDMPRTTALLDVRECSTQGAAPRRAFGRVIVTTPGVLPPEARGGRQVAITGVLAPPRGKPAEGLFDYRRYLARQEIYYQLKAGGLADWELQGVPVPPPWADRFRGWAEGLLARGLPVEDEPLRLLGAMTLGLKEVPNEVYEPFMKSGTMHIFAVSGLHIALICGALVALLRVARLSRAWCGLVVVPLIWFYTGATGWQPSAIRSTVMMTVVVGGWALRRPTDLLNSLAAAALVILWWDPQQLFGASFQLSFLVVLSLALFVPPIVSWIDRQLASDPLLPRQLLPTWRVRLNTVLRWLGVSVATSLAAWVGSVPLTAWYFHLVSPMTLVANLVVVPLSSLALAANLGSLLLTWWLPWAGELLNHSAWFCMCAMMRISAGCEFLPAAFWYVPAPGLPECVAYYALLLGLLRRTPGRRLCLVAGAAALVTLAGWHWLQARTTARLELLPAGGGMVLYTGSSQFGGQVLVDCGATNLFTYETRPFLRAWGVNRLSRLVLTHGDVRHVGAAEAVAEAFRVRRVMASPARARSPAYRQALAAFATNRLETVADGSPVGAWQVLHPAREDRWSRADDAALVLTASVYGTRVLLLSDLSRPGQEALMRRHPDLRAEVVITGLPLVQEPVCDELLDQLQPELLIVVDAEFPVTEQVRENTRARLAAWPFQTVYATSTGGLTLELSRNGWRLRAVNGGTCSRR